MGSVWDVDLGNGLVFHPNSLILAISDDVRNLLSVLTSHAGRGGEGEVGCWGWVFLFWKPAWAVLSSTAALINSNLRFS